MRLDGSTSSTDAKPGTNADGATGPSNGSDKSGCKYQAHKTGLTQLQQAGGLSFNVYAPPSYDPKVGHTVVVIMHGQDSNGVPERTALWQPIADTVGETLVLVAPKGSRAATNGDANAANWATADLNHVTEIMGLVDDCYDVFPKKHILWGARRHGHESDQPHAAGQGRLRGGGPRLHAARAPGRTHHHRRAGPLAIRRPDRLFISLTPRRSRERLATRSPRRARSPRIARVDHVLPFCPPTRAIRRDFQHSRGGMVRAPR